MIVVVAETQRQGEEWLRLHAPTTDPRGRDAIVITSDERAQRMRGTRPRSGDLCMWLGCPVGQEEGIDAVLSMTGWMP